MKRIKMIVIYLICSSKMTGGTEAELKTQAMLCYWTFIFHQFPSSIIKVKMTYSTKWKRTDAVPVGEISILCWLEQRSSLSCEKDRLHPQFKAPLPNNPNFLLQSTKTTHLTPPATVCKDFHTNRDEDEKYFHFTSHEGAVWSDIYLFILDRRNKREAQNLYRQFVKK